MYHNKTANNKESEKLLRLQRVTLGWQILVKSQRAASISKDFIFQENVLKDKV